MDKTSPKFLRSLATELEYALTVFQETCSCGLCGPCKRQQRMKSLITRARAEANELSQRKKR